MEGVLVCVLCVEHQEEEGSSVAGIDVWQISRWKMVGLRSEGIQRRAISPSWEE